MLEFNICHNSFHSHVHAHTHTSNDKDLHFILFIRPVEKRDAGVLSREWGWSCCSLGVLDLLEQLHDLLSGAVLFRPQGFGIRMGWSRWTRLRWFGTCWGLRQRDGLHGFCGKRKVSRHQKPSICYFLSRKNSASAGCSCTCSTSCIGLCLRMSLILGPTVILPDGKQVRVHGARAGHSAGVSAVPVIPLCYESHHQILQFCQLHLRDRGNKHEWNKPNDCETFKEVNQYNISIIIQIFAVPSSPPCPGPTC